MDLGEKWTWSLSNGAWTHYGNVSFKCGDIGNVANHVKEERVRNHVTIMLRVRSHVNMKPIDLVHWYLLAS